jgi:hypothetical protein
VNAVTFLQALIEKHASNGLLVDTNLLLLFLVGAYDRGYIRTFKRTQRYTEEDFDLLAGLIPQFHRIVVTPHILAELSNLSLAMKGDRAVAYFVVLVEVLREAREVHIDKDVLLDYGWLPRVGFTDLSILEASKRHDYLVLTDDFEAAGLLACEGCDVINWNHVRQLSWFQ